MSGWIGVDLDGTLAVYDGFVSPSHIGPPVPEMLERVKGWLEKGYEIRIFTARVSVPSQAKEAQTAIFKWCEEHLGQVLAVTCKKDYQMIELWDDRCVQVVPNLGIPVGKSRRGLD